MKIYLVLPVSKLGPFTELAEDQNFQVLVPSCCDDPEGGHNKVPLNDLLIPLDPSFLPEERIPGYGVNTVNCIPNYWYQRDNYVSLKSGHGLVKGDFLVTCSLRKEL